jgi:heterotetrameric sarcosine oxidase gamma subunit
VLEKNSALGAVLKSGSRDGAGGQHGLRVGEAKGWKLVQVAAFPGTIVGLEGALRPLLRAELPVRVGQATAIGARRLLKIGPEQFWIITLDDEDIAPDLQCVVTPTLGSVTALSHSRTCLWIDGPRSREVLETGIALDLHPEVFRQNFFGLTGLHHTPITVYRSDESRYELYVLRTFAVWAWEWLIDAALPFGYEIVETG